MRILGFSVPMIVLLIGSYIIGAKYPGIFNSVRSKIGM